MMSNLFYSSLFGFSLKKNNVIWPLVLLLLAGGCQTDTPTPKETPEPITLYAGRSESLVQPLIEKFTASTGIEVKVRYGNTAQLANALLEEGAQSPADVFWAQDAGALGAVEGAGLFTALPDSVLSRVPENFRSGAGQWVATSGRARTLAYAPSRAAEEALPQSIFDLTDPQWKGRIGWAPANGSFQAFVTAMRALAGEEQTKAWLMGVRDNKAKAYAKNSAIIEAIAAGEVDLGLPNHYYLLRYKNEDADYPVAQAFFTTQDAGNLVNVAGAGILKTSTNPAAYRLMAYLLSADAQAYFTNEVFEYPVVAGVPTHENLIPLDALMQKMPALNLNSLNDLEATLNLLREVELL